MDPTPVRVFAIGPFRLDLSKRALFGQHGDAPLPLTGRAFDVLACLVENRYRVVTKDELLGAVWPRLVVEESNVAQAITAIRRVLGDSREAPRFVVTVAGRGYQFIGEVVPLDPLPEAAPLSAPPTETAAASPPAPLAAPIVAPPSRRRFLLASAATVVLLGGGGLLVRRFRERSRAAAPVRSIAVLPFRPLAGDTRDAALEVGIAELLINHLSELPGLTVQPLSSVLQFIDRDLDPLAAGRLLGVDAVIEGAVQVRDGRVRATARLLDARSGRALWAGRYTEQFDDFFAVQDSIAEQVSAALSIVTPGVSRVALARRGTRNATAWQHYATGRFLQGQREASAVRRALEAFEEAERLDPQFAQAVAAQSDAWALLAVFGAGPTRASLERALALARRALATTHGPYLPEAHTALGHAQTHLDRDHVAGRESYRRALTLRPTDSWSHALLALNLTMGLRFPLAYAHIRSARQHEPSAMPYAAIEGLVDMHAGDLEQAERQLRALHERLPGAPLPRQFLASVLLARGAAAEVVTLLEQDNSPAPGWYSNLARALAQTGHRDAALAELERIEALGRAGHGVGFELALIHLDLGNRERAIAELERGIDDCSMMLGYARSHPASVPLRDDPRFAAVMARIRFD